MVDYFNEFYANPVIRIQVISTLKIIFPSSFSVKVVRLTKTLYIEGYLWSISSTFYARVFRTKVFSAAFFLVSNPKHRFVIFGAKILYEKCLCKMLMTLTPVLLVYNLSLSRLRKNLYHQNCVSRS
jgi:hypothetical protein